MLQLIGLIDPSLIDLSLIDLSLIDLSLIDLAQGLLLPFVWLPWPFDCRRGGLVGPWSGASSLNIWRG